MTDRIFENQAAEISVLGAALKDERSARLTAELEAEDFTLPAHRVIYQVIRQQVLKNEPVDLLTISSALKRTGQMETAGGDACLVELTSQVPTTANVTSYIDLVRECAGRRRLRDVGQALINDAGDSSQSVAEIRENAVLQLHRVSAGAGVRLIPQMEAVMAAYEAMENRQQIEGKEQKEPRIMSNIRQLDDLTGGLYGSKLVVIGARPAVGKSVFALNLCAQAARQKKRALFVSLEMDETELLEREYAQVSLVPLSIITGQHIPAESWFQLAGAMTELAEWPLVYSTDANTVDKVRAAAFELKERGGLDLICVDYLQLMEAGWARRQSRTEQVGEISRGLKKLAQELNIPVIALTQLNRSSEKSVTGGKIRRAPTMSEARESGTIEQDANLFLLLHDPEENELKTAEEKAIWNNLRNQGQKLIRVILEKNRQGKTGMMYLSFDGEHMRFLPVTHCS